MGQDDFDQSFEKLVGHPPLSWQRRLYQQWADTEKEIAPVIDLPTGMGKTMAMAIWLLARQTNPKLGRRLIYVVDRRTVVDQATDLAELLAEKAPEVGLERPAISTLRGQHADNREWSRDPSKSAIIIGTVDLIGSALLFSGYRSSYKRRPLEAGLLGQDSLLILDEAHLSKPFEKLLGSIEHFQSQRCSGHRSVNPMRVVRMSATRQDSTAGNPFELEPSDRDDPTIKQRFESPKTLTIRSADNIHESIALAAGEVATANPGSRIVIFVRSPKDVVAVRNLIKKDKSREPHIARLTGTMRGLERDELVDTKTPIGENQHERRVMRRFLSPDNDASLPTCFLISTSAGEVGFDLNADHLVGDAAPLDSWIQRLGRVNRRGTGNATVVLVRPNDPPTKTPFDKACATTTDLLKDVTDVSPMALAAFKSTLPREQLQAASTPTPQTVELTDILLDAWSMTSIIEPMPGRPEVGPWLRGIDDELPQTTFAWRLELDLPGFADLDAESVEEWFDTHRILTHETLSVPTSTKSEASAEKWIKARWEQIARLFGKEVWDSLGKRQVVIDRDGLSVVTLTELVAQLERNNVSFLRNAVVILPASFGGIERGGGLLDASVPGIPDPKSLKTPHDWWTIPPNALTAPDVADTSSSHPRQRVVVTRGEDGNETAFVIGNGTLPPGRKNSFRIDLMSEDSQSVRLLSHVPPPDKPELGIGKAQTLASHVGAVASTLDVTLGRLNLPDQIKRAAQFAAEYHDHGKNRDRWQRSVNGTATLGTTEWTKQLVLDGDGTGQCLGKSAGPMKRDPRAYRHEFGSLREFADAFKSNALLDHARNPISQDVLDLAMHLIATHHGRGRPHFPRGGFDPDSESRSDEIHADAIRRFARLQRNFGWWHLAWLENLLRCSDAIASAPATFVETTDRTEDTQ